MNSSDIANGITRALPNKKTRRRLAAGGAVLGLGAAALVTRRGRVFTRRAGKWMRGRGRLEAARMRNQARADGRVMARHSISASDGFRTVRGGLTPFGRSYAMAERRLARLTMGRSAFKGRN